jgi:hypothetical protein
MTCARLPAADSSRGRASGLGRLCELAKRPWPTAGLQESVAGVAQFGILNAQSLNNFVDLQLVGFEQEQIVGFRLEKAVTQVL